MASFSYDVSMSERGERSSFFYQNEFLVFMLNICFFVYVHLFCDTDKKTSIDEINRHKQKVNT